MRVSHLAVDFGSSHTVAVVRRGDGRVEALLFDGSPLLPSAVYADADGVLVVGADALSAGLFDPAGLEPHPKRRVDDGTVLLGGREFAVVELFAAVLGRVFRRCAEMGAPERVTLTHPASWGAVRRGVLREAAARAGFGAVEFMPEPVAAAYYYTGEMGVAIPEGAVAAVHDLGGGTFDASVVRRVGGGFEVLGFDGLGNLGGVDVDEAVVRWLRRTGDPEAWRRLLDGEGPVERRAARRFREDVRLAKERLSRLATASVHVPVVDVDAHLTREELEAVTRPLLARAVTATRSVVREAGVGDGEVASVLLVGGGSRIPLAATLLHREFGRAPVLSDQVELAVAYGAVLRAARSEPGATVMDTAGDTAKDAAGVPVEPAAGGAAGAAGETAAGTRPRRRRLLASVAAVLALAIAGVVGWLVWPEGDEPGGGGDGGNNASAAPALKVLGEFTTVGPIWTTRMLEAGGTSLAVVGAQNGRVQAWDLDRKVSAAAFQTGVGKLSDLEVLVIGERRFVVTVSEGHAEVHVLAGTTVCSVDAEGFFERVAVASPGGRGLFMSTDGLVVKVWDVEDCREVASYDLPGRAGAALPKRVWALPVFDETRMVVVAEDGLFGPVDLLTGKDVPGYAVLGLPTNVVFPGGTDLVDVGEKKVTLWDARTGVAKGSVEFSEQLTGAYTARGDGGTMLAAVQDFAGYVRLCDLGSGRELGAFRKPDELVEDAPILGLVAGGRVVMAKGSTVTVLGLG